MTLNEFCGKLTGVRRNGPGWMGRCPAHAEATDRRILLKCFAGCETGAVLARPGLTERDLFPDRASGHVGRLRTSYDNTIHARERKNP